MQLFALFRLAFATAPHLQCLTLLHTITHRLIMQKARRQECKHSLRPLVGIWFQVLFHSPPGVLFTFPSRYWFTIGHHTYLALADGPARFRQDFSCPALLGKFIRRYTTFAYRTITCYGRTFQTVQLAVYFVTPWEENGPP